MSTRCAITFCFNTEDHKQKEAIVYRHSDGYPRCAGKDLLQFFKDVRQHAKEDTRFDDPVYLAAKFIVLLTLRYAGSDWRKKDGNIHPLGQVGVGVLQRYPVDLEYVYVVVCKNEAAEPEVWVHTKLKDGRPIGKPLSLADVLTKSKEASSDGQPD